MPSRLGLGSRTKARARLDALFRVMAWLSLHSGAAAQLRSFRAFGGRQPAGFRQGRIAPSVLAAAAAVAGLAPAPEEPLTTPRFTSSDLSEACDSETARPDGRFGAAKINGPDQQESGDNNQRRRRARSGRRA